MIAVESHGLLSKYENVSFLELYETSERTADNLTTFWYSHLFRQTQYRYRVAPKKCIHSLLINIFGINLNKISISGGECNIMFSQQMAQQALHQLHWMIYRKHRNVVCSYHAGQITERSWCSSSAASTVFGCRWWPLRTPTLNPKFKDISHINFAFV
jgi:hypothetical protein